MKLLPRVAAAIVLLALSSNFAFAERWEEHRSHASQHYADRHGERHEHEAWQARYDDRRAPRGYEWRYYDGRYVLVALATGLIVEGLLYAR